MKTNRPFKLFSLLVVAALLLAACGGPATQEAPPAATQAPVATEAPAAPEAPAATQPPQAGETKEVVVWGFVWTADWLDAIAPDLRQHIRVSKLRWSASNTTVPGHGLDHAGVWRGRPGCGHP